MNQEKERKPLANLSPTDFQGKERFDKSRFIKKEIQSHIYGPDYMADLYYKQQQQTYQSLSHFDYFRGNCVDQLISLVYDYKQRKRTYFQAVYIMDKYLKNKYLERFTQKDIYQLGLVSFFIASKFQEVQQLSTQHLSQYDENLTDDRIKYLEQEIMKTIDYDIQITTSYDVLRCYLKIMDYPKNIQTIAKVFCTIALHYGHFTQHYPSNIAAAAFAIALKCQGQNFQILPQIINVQWNQIHNSFTDLEAAIMQTPNGLKLEWIFKCQLTRDSQMLRIKHPKIVSQLEDKENVRSI